MYSILRPETGFALDGNLLFLVKNGFIGCIPTTVYFPADNLPEVMMPEGISFPTETINGQSFIMLPNLQLITGSRSDARAIRNNFIKFRSTYFEKDGVQLIALMTAVLDNPSSPLTLDCTINPYDQYAVSLWTALRFSPYVLVTTYHRAEHEAAYLVPNHFAGAMQGYHRKIVEGKKQTKEMFMPVKGAYESQFPCQYGSYGDWSGALEPVRLNWRVGE